MASEVETEIRFAAHIRKTKGFKVHETQITFPYLPILFFFFLFFLLSFSFLSLTHSFPHSPLYLWFLSFSLSLSHFLISRCVRACVRPSVRRSVCRPQTSRKYAKVPFLTKTTTSTSENASYAVYPALFLPKSFLGHFSLL